VAGTVSAGGRFLNEDLGRLGGLDLGVSAAGFTTSHWIGFLNTLKTWLASADSTPGGRLSEKAMERALRRS